MAHFVNEIQQLIEKHNLGEGSIVGGPIHDPRRFLPVATPELEADLHRLNISFERTVADNDQHPDFGKALFDFTLFKERGEMPKYSEVWRHRPDDPYVVVGNQDVAAFPDRTSAINFCDNMTAECHVEHRPTKLVCHRNYQNALATKVASDEDILRAMGFLAPIET